MQHIVDEYSRGHQIINNLVTHMCVRISLLYRLEY